MWNKLSDLYSETNFVAVLLGILVGFRNEGPRRNSDIIAFSAFILLLGFHNVHELRLFVVHR